MSIESRIARGPGPEGPLPITNRFRVSTNHRIVKESWPLGQGARLPPEPRPAPEKREGGRRRRPACEGRAAVPCDRSWKGRAYSPLSNPRREPSCVRPRSGATPMTRRGGDGGLAATIACPHAGGFLSILRKEVIQPQVPLRLPCYDLVPITGFIFGACLSAPTTSDAPRFGGLTGGVYKAQEHIHRGNADPRLLAIPASCGRVAARNPNWGAVFAIGSALRPGSALSAPL